MEKSKDMLIKNIPGEKYRAFKAVCILNDKNIRDVQIEMMDIYVNKHYNKVNKSKKVKKNNETVIQKKNIVNT